MVKYSKVAVTLVMLLLINSNVMAATNSRTNNLNSHLSSGFPTYWCKMSNLCGPR